MQILQLFVADIHFKSERYAKKSDALKLLVINDEDHSESGIYSVQKLDKLSFRFHQTICVPLNSSQDNLHLHKFHFQVFQVNQDGARKLASASAHSSNLDSKISQTIDLLDHHGEVVGILMLSMLFSPSPIDIGEEVHFKSRAPNKSKEYAFLLSRKIRRPTQDTPVAFDPKLDRNVRKDARHYQSVEKPAPQRSASVPKQRPTTQSAPLPKPSSSTPSSSRPKQRSESPRMRTTAMGVGFVKNAWPEPQDYAADKQLFKLRLAADKKKELLHEIAQQMSASRKASSSRQAPRKPRAQSTPKATKRLSSELKAREEEIRDLKEQLSRLQVDSKALSSSRRTLPVSTSLSSPRLYDTRRYSALAERLIDSFEERHRRMPPSSSSSAPPPPPPPALTAVPHPGRAGGNPPRSVSRPRPVPARRPSSTRASSSQVPSRVSPAPRGGRLPPSPSIPFSQLSRIGRAVRESGSSSSRGKGEGGERRKRKRRGRTEGGGQACAPSPPSYLSSHTEEEEEGPSRCSSLLLDEACLPPAPLDGGQGPGEEEDDDDGEDMHSASLFPDRLLTSSRKYDYVIGGRPVAGREARPDVVTQQLQRNRSFQTASTSPSPPPAAGGEREREGEREGVSDTSVSSEAETVDRLLPLAEDKTRDRRTRTVPPDIPHTAPPHTSSSSSSSAPRNGTQRTQASQGKALDRIQLQFEKNRRYHEADGPSSTLTPAPVPVPVPAVRSVSQGSDASSASAILRNLENASMGQSLQRTQRWPSYAASDDLSSDEERRVFRKFLDEEDEDDEDGGEQGEGEGEEHDPTTADHAW